MSPAKTAAPAGGDAPPDKDTKKKEGVKDEKRKKPTVVEPEPEELVELPKTPEQIALEEAEYRSMLRKQRFKRRWPEISKVKIRTRPWQPPPPPQKLPPVVVEVPEMKLRRWVPPYRRRRRMRQRRTRIPQEEITQPLQESSKLNRIWHNFSQVERNKMMLQGSIGCNSKRYSSTHCGSQTGCIAVVCRALLEEKDTSQLVRRDVDDVIANGDAFYKRCMLALKCYKGKPQLELNQLLTSFFLHDTKYTVKMVEVETGLLAKHPDNIQAQPDLMALMEKRVGQTYMMILTLGGDRHFLIWGHPPTEGGNVKTIAYIFDPMMLDEFGHPHKLIGGGAFIRYAGISSFVVDFLTNYGDLLAARRGTPEPPITLTNIEVVQKEPLIREPRYDLDFKALKAHCRSEWDSLHVNALIEKKRFEGQYPQCSLSAVSLATSRATSKRKVKDFYQKTPREPPPVLPVNPEKAPPGPTLEQLMSLRGEDFFLYCPKQDGHTYGRDDMIPRPKSETLLHSPVDIADKNYHSQYTQVDAERWILRGTRHFASYRYQTFKSYTGVACCVAALGVLKRLRARGWCEDTLDETLDLGYNLFRESLVERGGPIRRLVLGELKENFTIRDQEYNHKERGIAVWGKMVSSDPKVFDLCRGLEQFFKESDSGILQIPGEFESAIWHEGGKFYIYHPWPADRFGKLLGLRDGGKSCIMYFTRTIHLCEHLLETLTDYKRRPFSISDVGVTKRKDIPQPLNNLNPVAPNRWVLRGAFHEGDSRFPEEHRNKQGTPMTIMALAMAQLRDTDDWTPSDVDDILVRGDMLYQSTMEHLERMGISLESPRGEEEGEGEEEERGSGGTLAAADVMNKFKVTDYDHIETEVMDSAINGSLNPEPGSGILTLTAALKQLFKEYSSGVVTARGASLAVWRKDKYYYMFDPHGCDENGYPFPGPRAGAVVVRLGAGVSALAAAVVANLPSGADDTFNVSPVALQAARINPEIGAPETKLESKAFEWMQKGTAAIMMGPRGENSAIGKVARKAAIGDEDKAGRVLALPAAAAFCAATASVPPGYMHHDHMYNLLEAGKEYYLNHVSTTGRAGELTPEELTDRFQLGANTFTVEFDEPVRLPFRLPDEPQGEGAEEESAEKELGEGEEEPKDIDKQIKDTLFRQWNDFSKPAHVSLLYGDYHQLGIWISPGSKVVAFDPAPTLHKGRLTSHRIQKGDEIRLQRIKDEMSGEGGGGDEEEEEDGAEGEEKPEPEPEPVPPESCPVLIVCSSPGELIDKLAFQGGLDRKQCLAPYKLYPVKVINELTSTLKDKRTPPAKEGEEAPGEEEEEVLVDPLEDAAMGNYFTRLGRTTASVRARLAQDENCFMDAQRDLQDAATSVMGIVVEHIEPYQYWKPALIDAVLKYGDRLYTLSLNNAKTPPHVRPSEIAENFHVTHFSVRVEINPEAVAGDLTAGETGSVLNMRRAIESFFQAGNKYGVICAKDYCVAIWKGVDDKATVLWEPHSVGPAGRSAAAGAGTCVLFSAGELLAETVVDNVRGLNRDGGNRFTISSVKVFWEFSKPATGVTLSAAVPDEGYEWKVLTAYVETARGRTVLRGTRPPDLHRFTRDALLQSSCGAVVACCMSLLRRAPLWTRHTVDEVMAVACKLFVASLGQLGYEFRPGEDVLLPLQVLKRYVLGVNYIRYELQQVYSGKLEQKTPTEMTVRCALERFFESHTHGVLWSVPHAVAVWRVAGSPAFYMMEPHACGPTGLRIDAQDDGAACVLTFTSAKLMAFAYLQNIPVVDRPRHEFQLYAMSMTVQPIKKLGGVEPPLVRAPPHPAGVRLVPATSKVDIRGLPRRAAEGDRKHPPGSATCLDAQRAANKRDTDLAKLKGQRSTSGWLVLNDGTQFLSAQHSMACRKFPYASRGNQALSCCVMSVAMSAVIDVCRWCGSTLDAILEAGDQLHQDSYLHYKPKCMLLNIYQVLRKFYTPGNCVCRVVVYKARQGGVVDANLLEQVTEFFREERSGVLVAGTGDFAVALFRTPRGYYMFDPADRDRYGRAVAPPCRGKARACFSQYPNIQTLIEKLGPNIPPVSVEGTNDHDKRDSNLNRPEKEVKIVEPKPEEEKEVKFEEPASFKIYGMDVTSLRRLNRHEK